MKKVLLVSNRGGHFSQLLVLLDAIKNSYDCHIITDNTGVARESLSNEQKTFFEDFRFKPKYLQLIYFTINMYQSFRLILKYKPDVIITTGASLAIPVFFVGKLFRIKLVFIESRAKVYSKTKTGKLLGNISDLILVQWNEMLDIYGIKAQYWGQLF